VKPLWHPLSTLLLTDPPCLANPALLRMLLPAGPLELRYAGDRMWPTLRHGDTVRVERADGAQLRPGSLVVVAPDGIPDLLRVRTARAGRLTLAADADPRGTWSCDGDAVLARVPGRHRGSPGMWRRHARRVRLELAEARRGRPDEGVDPGASVKNKYDQQAEFYVRGAESAVERRLFERLEALAARDGRILVVGSGAGKECFELARRGYTVLGIDFAEAMVRASREQAAKLGLDVDLRQGDVAELVMPAASLGTVLFTYDVYSFVPGRARRVELLRRIAGWLGPGAPLLVSARRVRSSWERLLLGVTRLSSGGRRGFEPGDSHTRWIDATGRLRRSYVHVFTPAEFRHEVQSAGLVQEEWEGAHAVLRTP
jgi:SAM-dependent methyltransferase